jgi:hypothetical protein
MFAGLVELVGLMGGSVLRRGVEMTSCMQLDGEGYEDGRKVELRGESAAPAGWWKRRMRAMNKAAARCSERE